MQPSLRFFRITSKHRASAVHGHDSAVDEARFLGKQVGDGCGHLLGMSRPSQRVQEAHILLDVFDHCGFLAGEELFVAFGGDRAECYGVRPAGVRSVVRGQGSDQPLDGDLRRRVGEGSPDCPLRSNRQPASLIRSVFPRGRLGYPVVQEILLPWQDLVWVGQLLTIDPYTLAVEYVV